MPDPSWVIFQEELAKHMQRRQVGPTELARILGIENPRLITLWKRGDRRPLLSELSKISQALSMHDEGADAWDPTYLPRKMGILDPSPSLAEAVRIAVRLQKLEEKFRRFQERVASHGREWGAARVVQRACELGSWAVAVWPAIEGPSYCRMHVADRLDFRSTVGAPVSDEAVWEDFSDVLREVFAVRSSVSEGRWQEGKAGVSWWSIPRIGAPSIPLVDEPHSELRGVLVISTTIQAWVNDVASHLADALGYGLVTTRDIAMDLFGQRHGPDADVNRGRVFTNFLARPPEKRVISHYGLREHGLDQIPDRLPPGFGIVWLRESDALLKLHCKRHSDLSLTALKNTRRAIDASLPRESGRIFRVDVDFGRGELTRDVRSEQALKAASAVLAHYLNLGLLDRQAIRAVHDRAVSMQPTHRGCDVIQFFRTQEWA